MSGAPGGVDGGGMTGKTGTTGRTGVLPVGGRPPTTITGEICPGASGIGGRITGPPEGTGCRIENRGEGIASGPAPNAKGVPPRVADAKSTMAVSGWFSSWAVGPFSAVGDIGCGDRRLPQRARAQLVPSVSKASPRIRRTG